MTQPERIAPDDVSRAAAHFLDTAAVHLDVVAKREKLELKPYDTHQPGQTRWLHGLYGSLSNKRAFCIQVVTDDEMAHEFRASLNGWIQLYPADGSNAWVLIETLTVAGMEDLVTSVMSLTTSLRAAGAWRFRRPPDHGPGLSA
jgi:hypothetical protein